MGQPETGKEQVILPVWLPAEQILLLICYSITIYTLPVQCDHFGRGIDGGERATDMHELSGPQPAPGSQLKRLGKRPHRTQSLLDGF
jgi:hypothetical protein